MKNLIYKSKNYSSALLFFSILILFSCDESENKIKESQTTIYKAEQTNKQVKKGINIINNIKLTEINTDPERSNHNSFDIFLSEMGCDLDLMTDTLYYGKKMKIYLNNTSQNDFKIEYIIDDYQQMQGNLLASISDIDTCGIIFGKFLNSSNVDNYHIIGDTDVRDDIFNGNGIIFTSLSDTFEIFVSANKDENDMILNYELRAKKSIALSIDKLCEQF